MKVSAETLSKIAAQMGYKPFVSEEKGIEVSPTNFILDFTVLSDFLYAYEAGHEIEGTEDYILNEKFYEEHSNVICRAMKQSVSVILGESSEMGRQLLTEKLKDRIDILEMMIADYEFEDFIDYLTSNKDYGDGYNGTYLNAKNLIKKWMKDEPNDYLGLLFCRLFHKSYDEFFENHSVASSIILENKDIELTNCGRFGGIAINLAARISKENRNDSLKVNIKEEGSNKAALKWQLQHTGFIEIVSNKFIYLQEAVA